MSDHALSPFDLSLVMEQIGSYLKITDLISCTLVSREWHSHFGPFIWWHILDDCEGLLARIYSKSLKAPDDIEFHLESEYVKAVSMYTKLIDGSSRAYHNSRRTHLNNLSYASFIIMGWLCDDIRHIDFVFSKPSRFSPQSKSKKDYRLSTEYFESQERCDRVIEIVEKSRMLESLQINGNSLSLLNKAPHYLDNYIYRWIKISNTSTPIIPQWPCLTSVLLGDCQIDQEFIKQLLLNSPSLAELYLSRIRINCKTSGTALNLSQIFDTKYPPIEELMFEIVTGVTMNELIQFASILPNLERLLVFNGYLELSAVHVLNNFSNLRELNLRHIDQRHSDSSIASIIWNSPQLEMLSLEDVPLTTLVFNAIQGLSNSIKDIFICQHVRDMRDNDHGGLHKILASCRNLKSFRCYGVTLLCNPQLFDTNPWICTDIEVFSIAPDCIPINTSYSSEDATDSFFLQLSRLSNLHVLAFSNGVGKRDFTVENGIGLLAQYLVNLEILCISSGGLETNANLNVEHAKVIAKSWPRLRAIQGFYHMDRRDFVDYMGIHRPDINLAYA